MPVVKELMKQICEKYKKDGKSYTEEFRCGKTKIFFRLVFLLKLKKLERTESLNLSVVFICVQKPSHKESLLNKNSMNILPLLSFKIPFTLGTNSEIGTAAKDKEIETVKKKLAEEIRREKLLRRHLLKLKSRTSIWKL
ncbi:hypothetical protein EIN_443530 [Entamoeba invadens IP1]|uniref:Uncharacterized protein n=1 Tax=Entamoeba invadens IP1 TaxID=370355 RepID=A0A0A1UB17_ENTIV|nr:hypothetical protein EIN_443530 [Entamoeba invadens IP1]ELP92383.1 hypothetical protein EIN_443530 [Entamoeba invadens IP1]|eukprot:XP_004259154.1 hypothetical protein EIN_443530 [Entamoeba invadens IP1]